jgi:translation elongation factor EF-Tu-like GTPase
METRELLEEMGVHIVQGSALCALEDTKPELGWRPSTSSLIEGVEDQTIPNPRKGLLDHREAGAG